MIIQPNSDPQEITFRCRPHEDAVAYLLFAWIETDKVYPIIADLDYIDGHLSGLVEFEISRGLVNGSRITIRVFGVTDLISVEDAIEALSEEPPYIATTEQVSAIIDEQTSDETITKELFRGQIFVSNRTEQPFNIT